MIGFRVQDLFHLGHCRCWFDLEMMGSTILYQTITKSESLANNHKPAV